MGGMTVYIAMAGVLRRVYTEDGVGSEKMVPDYSLHTLIGHR